MANQSWITPVNPNLFRIVEAYEALNEIDWRLSAKPEVGDIVYIYISNDCKYVKYKTIAVATGIKPENIIDDSEFVTELGNEELPHVKSFTRLKLLQTFEDNELPKSILSKHGLKGNIQNTQRLPKGCIELLHNYKKVMKYPHGHFAYLIDECSKGRVSKGVATAQNVRKVLPELVKWAKEGRKDGNYKELIKACGYPNFSGVGHVLGVIHEILAALSKETGEEIPTLNTLVTNPKSGLPSYGFEYVFPGYEKLDDEAKRKLVSHLNTQSFYYKQWDWVLYILGLKEEADTELIEKIRKGAFGFGGEGEEHRKLKLYISKHPEVLAINTHCNGETEHILLSGDRLDVFFPENNVAVEVKPSTAPEEDILRGIFQCVKYKAVLDAESKHNGEYNSNRVILALGGQLTEKTRKSVATLGVEVWEKVKIDIEEQIED